MKRSLNENNNISIVVSDSDSEDNKNDNDNKAFCDEDINNNVKANPKTNINTKVVCAMKKLQAILGMSCSMWIKPGTWC